LTNARLDSVDLRGSNLDGAQLDGAILSRSNLEGTSFVKASLIGARLLGSDLSGACLRQANLSKARLNGSRLQLADLSYADLSDSKMIRTQVNDANLQFCNLSRSDLSRSYLCNSDLTGANLVEAEIPAANLLKVNLYQANLSGANLSRTCLAYTNLRSTILTNADLRSADLTGIKDDNSNLVGTILGGNFGFSQTQADNWKARGAFIIYLQTDTQDKEIQEALEIKRKEVNLRETLEERKLDLLDVLLKLERNIEVLQEYFEELKEEQLLNTLETNGLESLISFYRLERLDVSHQKIEDDFNNFLKCYRSGEVYQWTQEEIEIEYQHWHRQIKAIAEESKFIQSVWVGLIRYGFAS